MGQSLKLTRSFSIEELTHTSTGLPNNPSVDEAAHLSDLASSILQPIRDYWGGVWVSSGYRSQAVNKKVGGSPTSQHCKGEAADIVPLEANIDLVFKWLVRESGIHYGQAILEKVNVGFTVKEWIHVSLPRPSPQKNHVAMTYNGEVYKTYGG